MASVRQVPDEIVAEQEADVGCGISRVLADKLDAAVGDSVYVCDSRWWTGGYHSLHATVAEITGGESLEISLNVGRAGMVIAKSREKMPVRVECRGRAKVL